MASVSPFEAIYENGMNKVVVGIDIANLLLYINEIDVKEYITNWNGQIRSSSCRDIAV